MRYTNHSVRFSTAASPLVLRQKTNPCRLERPVLLFCRAGFRWWLLIACLVTPLTNTSAQVRLGLRMPSLKPQAVTALDTVPPSLMPGDTITFTNADAVGGAAQPALIGLADVVTNEAPLRAFAYTIEPLQSSSASAFQYNDFAIPESTVVGTVTDSVVSAQISGSVSVRGFLFAMGAAEASAGVDIEVLDITDTNGPPLLVTSQGIADYEADDRLSPSVGGEVKVSGQAGFPYVGIDVGGGIQVALQLSPDLNFVRDDKTFGFTVLLQRGHVYRVQTELSVDTSDRVFNGTAIASFFSPFSGGPVIPNVFDPQPTSNKGAENSWLSLLKPKAGAIPDLQIAKGNADVVSERNLLGNPVSIWNADTSVESLLENPLGFISSGEGAKTFSGNALFTTLFSTPPLTLDTLVMNSPFLNLQNEITNEFIALPGVAVAGPTITLGNDQVELAEQATDRTIEQQLREPGDALVSLYLPAAFGGQLERCTALVSSLIAQSKAAGLRTEAAEDHLAVAVEAQGKGKYKIAYRQLHEAYISLVRVP